MTEQTSAVPSAGEILRTARERQGLHIAALAAAIKVSPRKLDALEHDRWDELPDATFIRALAQAICKTLKIDAAPVLALLPRTAAVVLEPVSPGLNAPFRERPAQDESGLSQGALRPMVIAASVLLVAAVAVYLLPEGLWSSIRPSTEATAPVPVAEGVPASAPISESIAAPMAAAPTTAPSTAPLPAAISTAVPTARPAPQLASSPSSAPALLTAKPASSSASAQAQLAGPKALAQAAASSRPAPAPLAAASAGSSPVVASTSGSRPPAASSAARAAASSLRLRTNGPSWVEVQDADGKLLLSRVLEAGEAVNVDGVAPLQLTVGNAGDTQVEYRGRAVDLAPKTRNNVARIELK